MCGVTEADPKVDLRRYQAAREALLWKLDGLSELDIRHPMAPTGTNLLGLVKHVAGVELGDRASRTGLFGPVHERDVQRRGQVLQTRMTRRACERSQS